MLAPEPTLFQIHMPATFQSKKLSFILGLVSDESNTAIQFALWLWEGLSKAAIWMIHSCDWQEDFSWL